MKKYNVDIAYSIIIEAKNKEQAQRRAIEILTNSEMYNQHNVDYEVCQVDTVNDNDVEWSEDNTDITHTY